MLQRRSLRFVQALLRCYWLLVCFNAPITDCFCGPCNRDNCVALNSTVCPYGTVFDGCCCMMCAKGPGEECGGIKLELCATGSRCMLEIEFGLFYSEYIQSRGICKLSEKLLHIHTFLENVYIQLSIIMAPCGLSVHEYFILSYLQTHNRPALSLNLQPYHVPPLPLYLQLRHIPPLSLYL